MKNIIIYLQIEREMNELKVIEDNVETHESGTESDKDAREAKVCTFCTCELSDIKCLHQPICFVSYTRLRKGD